MQQLDHPNIVKMYDWWLETSSNVVNYIDEFNDCKINKVSNNKNNFNFNNNNNNNNLN
jgi:hypothetical protein